MVYSTMRALYLLFALHVCFSSGEQWTQYPEINPKLDYNNLHQNAEYNYGNDYNPYSNEKLYVGEFSPFFLPPQLRPKSYINLNAQVTANTVHSTHSTNGNPFLEAQATQNDDVNSFTKPGYEVRSQNEQLPYNGDPNDISVHSGHTFGDDIDIKQGVKKVNNYVYILNKTNSTPQSRDTYASPVTTNLPSSANLYEDISGGKYWVNENNQNYKDSRLIYPYPSWDQRQISFPPNPVDIYANLDGFYPDNNNNGWYPPAPNHHDCHVLNDIIRDLRILLQKSTIGEEQYYLKQLFKIIRAFILNNNLQYASFGKVVREVGKALLRENNDHDSLREDEIDQILQQFKNRDLKNFLQDIGSHPEMNIEDVVAKLARLLYRFKRVLIQMKYSRHIIRFVISRAVQWSVPLVSYYLEKECKIKTQQYIVQNLEVALNLNLGSVQHVGNVDDLQTEFNFGGLGNVGGPANLGDSRNSGILGGLGYILSPGGQGNLGNVGGLGLANLVRPRYVDVLGSQGYVSGSGGSGDQSSLGISGGIGKQIYPGGIADLGNLIIPLKQGA